MVAADTADAVDAADAADVGRVVVRGLERMWRKDTTDFPAFVLKSSKLVALKLLLPMLLLPADLQRSC